MNLLTPKEAAELLRVPVNTVHRWSREGILPSFRLSERNVRFRRSEIEEWIEANRRPSRGL